ncbi:DJ-1/PfpI family protein [Rhodococcus sp. F64268]|uniref:DJ-1/PfpI family protein n=1 Tax=Rhodococcus sp. F64268 TaxID=2926402 RepID=UPI001FF41636|nr:DJ-1/PfpI family protein [Rhodococcus sp. F64268]MCK0093419.1 DJ-1/PfpI family protein [Rhodococcus sp. F64268]
MTSIRYGILLFDDVEVLDAFGPFEVFSVAARLSPADVAGAVLVSAEPERPTVRARGGLRVQTDVSIADAPPFDVLVVPGGVTDQVEQDEAVMSWIAARSSTPVVASVCTGDWQKVHTVE